MTHADDKRITLLLRGELSESDAELALQKSKLEKAE